MTEQFADSSFGSLQERRASDRFPIQREVCFRMHSRRGGDITGRGVTVNMSRNGILFSTDKMLLPGRRLELAMSWPAKLDNRCPLKFVVRGRVVRSEAGKAAVEIDQYEFRTMGAHELSV